jgi:hypothetical protein
VRIKSEFYCVGFEVLTAVIVTVRTSGYNAEEHGGTTTSQRNISSPASEPNSFEAIN